MFAMRWQTLAKTIGQNMRKYRRAKGLTQENAAAKANMSLRYWQQLESAEKNMTLKTLTSIARALEIDSLEMFK